VTRQKKKGKGRIPALFLPCAFCLFEDERFHRKFAPSERSHSLPGIYSAGQPV
jgi:hypothetical protein